MQFSKHTGKVPVPLTSETKLDFVHSCGAAKDFHNLGRRPRRQFLAVGRERRHAKMRSAAPERAAHESQHSGEGGVLLGVPGRPPRGDGLPSLQDMSGPCQLPAEA